METEIKEPTILYLNGKYCTCENDIVNAINSGVCKDEILEAFRSKILKNWFKEHNKTIKWPEENKTDNETYIAIVEALTGKHIQISNSKFSEYAELLYVTINGNKISPDNNVYTLDYNAKGEFVCVLKSKKPTNENFNISLQDSEHQYIDKAQQLLWKDKTKGQQVEVKFRLDYDNIHDFTLFEGSDNELCRFVISQSIEKIDFEVKGVRFSMVQVTPVGLQNSSFNSSFSLPTEPFYIGETVVTEALWCAVYENVNIIQGANYPITNRSYIKFIDFIERLNFILSEKLKDGKKFHIPFNNQWSYAAIGGPLSKDYYYPGSNKIAEVARYGGSRAGEVAKLKPNELGLYDMGGNVWEICNTHYPRIMAMGGGFQSNEKYCTAITCKEITQNQTGIDMGFRLALW